jgi:alpha-1,2-mannosyltransferase
VRTSRPQLALFLTVLVPLALLFTLTGQGNPDRLSPDPVAAGVGAWAVATTGGLDLTGADVPDNPWLVPWHGQVLSNRTPGVLAAGVPAALVGSALTPRFTLWPERVTAALCSAGAAALLALLLLELGASRRQAAGFALLGALATGTWAVSSDALWTHGPDQLLLVGALLATARRRFWVAGACLGVAVTVRPHLAVVPLVLGVVLALHERTPRRLFQFGVTGAAGVAAILLYSKAVFGLWSIAPGYTAKGYDYGARLTTAQGAAAAHNLLWSGLVNAAGAFFSPDRGLLVVSPVLLVLVLGLHRAWAPAPVWARTAAVSGIGYLAVQLRLNHFTGGLHFYGYRLTLETLTLCAPLLWLAWRERTRNSGWERAVWATLCLSVGNQLLGAVWVNPDGVVPEWRHSYVVEVFDPDLHPVVCQAVVLTSLAAALICVLRRPRARPASARAVPVSPS